MIAYDFEGVLYQGDIIEDLVDFVGNKKEKYKNLLPLAKPIISLYKMDFLSLDKLSKFANKYIKDFDISEKQVLDTSKEFWELNEEKLNKDLIKKLKKDDLIITILPVDFLKPLKLKAKNILGSIYNYDTNEIDFICYKEAKEKEFIKEYGDKEINEYYTSKKDFKEIINKAKKTNIIKK